MDIPEDKTYIHEAIDKLDIFEDNNMSRSEMVVVLLSMRMMFNLFLMY